MRRGNDGRYQVLGDCYFYRIMDGEALERVQFVRERFVSFNLPLDGRNQPLDGRNQPLPLCHQKPTAREDENNG
jgi:hypothetical protein